MQIKTLECRAWKVRMKSEDEDNSSIYIAIAETYMMGGSFCCPVPSRRQRMLMKLHCPIEGFCYSKFRISAIVNALHHLVILSLRCSSGLSRMIPQRQLHITSSMFWLALGLVYCVCSYDSILTLFTSLDMQPTSSPRALAEVIRPSVVSVKSIQFFPSWPGTTI